MQGSLFSDKKREGSPLSDRSRRFSRAVKDNIVVVFRAQVCYTIMEKEADYG